MAEQRLINANKEVIRAYEDIPEPYSDVLISFLRGCETIDPESLPIVQRLVEADKAAKLQRATKGDDSDESAQETAGERLP